MFAGLIRKLTPPLLVTLVTISLAACGGSKSEYPTTDGTGRTVPAPDSGDDRDRGSLLSGGFGLFGGDDDEDDRNAGIGVNSYLWRATLDTLSFMPLQSADPFGGVVISDWYEDPVAPGERFKITVYILDQRLRADGLKVAVFRQQNTNRRGWADVPVNPNTAIDIENAILTRARQLRIDSIEN